MRDFTALLARALISAFFLYSGARDLIAPAGLIHRIAAFSFPAPQLLAWVVIAMHLFGGVLLLIGARTRWAAGVLVLTLLAAGPGHVAVVLKNLAIAGGLLGLVALGPGRWSLDRG